MNIRGTRGSWWILEMETIRVNSTRKMSLAQFGSWFTSGEKFSCFETSTGVPTNNQFFGFSAENFKVTTTEHINPPHTEHTFSRTDTALYMRKIVSGEPPLRSHVRRAKVCLKIQQNCFKHEKFSNCSTTSWLMGIRRLRRPPVARPLSCNLRPTPSQKWSSTLY